MVHNRPDNNKEYQGWLSPFEIWLGTSFGDTRSQHAVRCGGPAISVAAAAGPFGVTCGGVRGRSFVTLVLIGKARWLTYAGQLFQPGCDTVQPAGAIRLTRALPRSTARCDRQDR